MAKMSTGMVAVLVVLAIIVTGGVVYFVVGDGGTKDILNQFTQQQQGDCEVEPYLDITLTESENTGTTTGATFYYELNGEYKGTLTSGSSGTVFSVGDKVKILASNASLVDKVLPEVTVSKCGSNPVSAKMDYLGTDPTLTIYDDAYNLLTDSATGGATNKSTFTTPTTLELRMVIADGERCENWVCTVENGNDTGLLSVTASSSDAQVSDYIKNGKPTSHSQEGSSTDSYFTSFWLKGVKGDGSTTKVSLTFTPESGGTVTSATYVTCEPAQAIVDGETGEFITSDIQDLDGTAGFVTSRDNDYDFLIV